MPFPAGSAAEGEFADLLGRAGFHLERVHGSPTPVSVVEALPA